MTARTTTLTGSGSPEPSGPPGLHFVGRTYSNNRIAGPTFSHDQNGNLVSEASHDGLDGHLYGFSRENVLTHIRSADSDRGRLLLEAAYDDQGHRWLRRLWSEGSKATITLRDATGKVTAEFAEDSASSSLKHVKDYIYAGSQLIAVNSYCGPRPDLVLDTPSRENGNVRFVRTDNVPSQDGFTILIQSASGQRKVLTRPSSLATHFEIAESEFFPYETNLVSIQTDAACGATGHSNAVSYAYVPPQEPAPTCLTTLGASRFGGVGGSTGSISLQSNHNCPSGTGYIVYYWRLGDDFWGPLNTEPATSPDKVLSNQPAGTGYGTYWVSPVISGVISLASGPPVELGPPNEDPDPGSGGGGGGATTPPAVNAQFFHWDHLGSTRAITDEKGVVIGKWKYYPFGHEAESMGAGDNRMLFTGHERDSAFGLDYMLARYSGPKLARLLSVDPLASSARLDSAQTWNRYAYAQNNPLKFTDPTGMEASGQDDAKKRAAQGAAVTAGQALSHDSNVRAKYTDTVHGLSPTDTAGRSAAKVMARDQLSPLGKAISEAMAPMADEAARAAGTASKTNAVVDQAAVASGVAGKGLLAVGVTMSVVNVATAPPGQRGQAAAREGGAWVGALSFGAAGAKGGAFFGSFFGPGGTAVGAVAGGLGGGIVGAIAGGKAADNVYKAVTE